VAPGTAVDGWSSSEAGVAANAAALKLANNATVLMPVTNRFMKRLLSGKKDTWPSCCAETCFVANKAAASEEATHTLRYVEPLSEMRTIPAEFLNILQERVQRGYYMKRRSIEL
jgi:hypothetical protein